MPASADGEEVGLAEAFYATQQAGGSNTESVPTSPASIDYDFAPTCGLGAQAICYEGAACFDAAVEGVLFDVFLDGEKVGETCVTEQEAAEQEQVTPGRVLRAFRSLTWPQSELTIQPPGGQTLVNFATNFYTDDDRPIRQRVRLLGQEVLIEATPTTYTWRFGDGVTSSTSTPGAAYPDLEVTHDYGTVDTFAPALDTTYTGRYRLNGGPWIAIPETLTVPGAAQQLEAIAARPTLVDH